MFGAVVLMLLLLLLFAADAFDDVFFLGVDHLQMPCNSSSSKDGKVMLQLQS